MAAHTLETRRRCGRHRGERTTKKKGRGGEETLSRREHLNRLAIIGQTHACVDDGVRIEGIDPDLFYLLEILYTE